MTHSNEESRWTLMAIAVTALGIIAILLLHLTIALVFGMLVYVAGRRLSGLLSRWTRLNHPDLWSVAILLVLIATVGSEVVERAGATAASGSDYPALFEQMAVALEQFRAKLPEWLAANVPISLEALRAAAASWLRNHAAEVRLWGQHALRGATYVLVGTVIGALAVVQTGAEVADKSIATPWLRALARRFTLFEQNFATVVFAQLRIATYNTVLTGVYLLVVLPALGSPLPLALTLVGFTFVASLIPVVGNLISNTVIVIISLTQGLGIAALSLGFLVAIHKLEYFLNAHIIGRQIQTKAFELLSIMLLFEAMFGVAGVVMAPIIYAYAKAELREAGWL